jgi:toxin ParE1/3/4
MNVIWSKESIVDLEDILNFISLDKQDAAEWVVLKVKLTVENLIAKFPEIGRFDEMTNTRVFTVKSINYKIVYRIKNTDLEIVKIFHVARLWPSYF